MTPSNKVNGDAGFWPFSNNVSVSFGDHPKAEPLQSLDLDTRALARVSVIGGVDFYPGERV